MSRRIVFVALFMLWIFATTAPKLYVLAGGIVGRPDIPHINFPPLMEMLYAWATLLRGAIAAKSCTRHLGFW